mmetsp:Transcript_22091/g.39621  ORF Transcript_22091/g.39621 Transcript_22091/m.39621 type:complete len:542 (+) Transcript_22091:104-1729(+)|eukprot:CAMPEP_0197652950 /NCGR_PEP_ID=MMETSP1338-20131121/34755_1 /TAXON_ID=43686 ORGANISM="Pelagodinium beii, Strain RCC1491" /NCGR_SAMPLE_ID=MMETSP1338 /ASSEMBLY_ACC=CAM_ASM_000754 /LENGTH=541 /DNA_ID=CAMNT_0043227923 /DNA_START=90 /DNA_END=1715 /DNA_ORIENTATION=-
MTMILRAAFLVAVSQADSCTEGTCSSIPEIRGSQLIQTVSLAGKMREGHKLRKDIHESRQAWDPELLDRHCLQAWMNETNTPRSEVCSDAVTNSVKDDKGNYIQFTRWEDRLMYSVWRSALESCAAGQPLVRDIIASFAQRQTCFINETTLDDQPTFYIPSKILVDGKTVINGTDKVLCTGDSKTANETQLQEQLHQLKRLVDKYDLETPGTPQITHVCQEMLEAHTLEKYSFIGILHSTRPAACNVKSEFLDANLCSDAEVFLTTFQQRDLFVTDADSGGFKGRAAEGENNRSEMCMEDETLKGEEWFDHKVTLVGSTTELCSIDTSAQPVFTEPVLKVGVYHEYQSDNDVADAYRQCGAPFVAGISATMPQYMAAVAAGSNKKGKNILDALDMQEILVLMSMLELGGFHAMTGLTMAVNYFYKDMVVIPPFDSGSFFEESENGIRCHDTITNCCTNATKANGFYNHRVYREMMESWSAIIDTQFPPSTDNLEPGKETSTTTTTTNTVERPRNTSEEPKSNAHAVAPISLLAMMLITLTQ